MSTPPLADAEHLARELHTHQVELEQQNEELLRAQLELAAARDRYQDLFEVAPVGYLSLDEAGRIAELNLTGATLLGQPRQQLLGRTFATVLHRSERRRWRNHLANLDGSGGRGRIEMTLDGDDMAPRHVQADTLRVLEPGADAALRLTLTDITERRAAETDRRIAAHLVEAREGERQRVARALHEDLGQRLSVLKMTLSVLGRSTPAAAGNGDARATPGPTDEVLHGLDEAIAVVRQMVNELHPSILDDLGLNAAMQWLADEAATRLGLQVRLHAAAGDPRLERRSAMGVYRLMESLLTEVARDEPGAQVDIELQESGEQLHLWLTARPGGWPAQPDAVRRPIARRADTSPTSALVHAHTGLLAELRTLGGRLIEARADADAYRVHAVLPRTAAVNGRSRATGASR
jgi:two-component system sensor histidine kinase UhpB